MLSVSELHAHSHLANSPSDTSPILGPKTKDTNVNPKEKSYQLPNVAMHWMTRCQNAYTLVMRKRLLARLSLAVN